MPATSFSFELGMWAIPNGHFVAVDFVAVNWGALGERGVVALWRAGRAFLALNSLNPSDLA